VGAEKIGKARKKRIKSEVICFIFILHSTFFWEGYLYYFLVKEQIGEEGLLALSIGT
jgi:hypothetical protein